MITIRVLAAVAFLDMYVGSSRSFLPSFVHHPPIPILATMPNTPSWTNSSTTTKLDAQAHPRQCLRLHRLGMLQGLVDARVGLVLQNQPHA
jgi:hypothetical protein